MGMSIGFMVHFRNYFYDYMIMNALRRFLKY